MILGWGGLFLSSKCDSQIFQTFAGCGAADPDTSPFAASGRELKEQLAGNHSFVFAIINKFNQPVSELEPYSTRDDIIVTTDEAHRTQAGKFARNIRLALPNAAFIGFTATLFSSTTISPSESSVLTFPDTTSSALRRTTAPSNWFTKTGADNSALLGWI